MKFKPKDWVMLGIVAVALVVFAYAIVQQRENLAMRESFTDKGWVGDDGTLQTVSITEDGTLWGTAPVGAVSNSIWRKLKGGAWTQVKGQALQIDGKDASTAVCVGTDNGLYQTSDGGQTWNSMAGGRGKWISIGDDGYILAIGTDENVYEWTGSTWVFPAFKGQGKQISVGARGVANVAGGGNVYELVPDPSLGVDARKWQNTGAPTQNVAVTKDNLSIELSTDGNVYYKTPGKPYVKFSGSNIRQLSASSTKLAAVTNDNKTWTMDITDAPAPAAAPAAAPVPAAPSPSAAPGLTAGNYSASCSRCQVINNQITCACDVLPK